MWGEAIGAAAAAGGLLAWGVRGRSSTLLAPGVWRGPRDRRAIALTFDDGPGEETPALLDLLARHGAKATFFQVGAHVRRLPDIACAVRDGGHEIGNHTETHAALYLRTAAFIEREIARAQESIREATGSSPTLFRPTYGARWFGLRAALKRHGLTNVMWTVIGSDWRLDGAECAAKLRRGAQPGAIFCLHDGRELQERASITSTLDALDRLLPELATQGYQFVTVSELLRRRGAPSIP